MSSTTATTARRSRRFLAPLATLAVAGALVIGSGADFTSASNNSNSVVASGSLKQTNSRSNAAIFNVNNIKPGDSVKGSVVITNNSSMPQKFSVTETATSSFTAGTLTMTVVETKTDGTTSTVYTGNFGGFATKDLGVFTTGEARTYAYTVTLLQAATNEEQNEIARAAYAWTGTQTNATPVDQTGAGPLSSTDTGGTNVNP